MRVHQGFEWDEPKAEKNLKKQGVSFDDAARVLGDDDGDYFHVDEYDKPHSDGEDRYLTTASHLDDRRIVLRIVWSDRSTDKAQITRIISARPATPRERKNYAKEIGPH
jgi:uncharacterized DUF497 family protein